jgi:hypothetical protein
VLATQAFRQLHARTEGGELGRQGVYLRAGHNEEVAYPHPSPEAGDKVAISSDHQEGTFQRISQCDCDSRRGLGELDCAQYRTQKLGILVQLQGEVHFVGRQAL